MDKHLVGGVLAINVFLSPFSMKTILHLQLPFSPFQIQQGWVGVKVSLSAANWEKLQISLRSRYKDLLFFLVSGRAGVGAPGLTPRTYTYIL